MPQNMVAGIGAALYIVFATGHSSPPTDNNQKDTRTDMTTLTTDIFRLPMRLGAPVTQRMLRSASPSVRALPSPERLADETRNIAFTFSVIALAGHVVHSGGQWQSGRYLAFREAFPIHASEDAKIRALFDLASTEHTSPELHAVRIMRLFPARPALYTSVMDRLVRIAAANGAMDIADISYLRRLAGAFGIRRRALERLLAAHLPCDNPYQLLQVRPYWRTRRIKAAYTRLLAACHPDRFQAQGACEAVVAHMNERASRITLAYATILQRRRLALRIGL